MNRLLNPSIFLLALLGGTTAWAAVPDALKKAPVAAPTVASAPATDQEIGITATMETPYDILVEWKDTAPGAAGYIVEWGTKPDDDFVPLGFFPPEQKSYRHPKLMPETMCYYRVRAFYGPASPEVEINLPKDLTDAEYKRRFDAPEDYHWCGPETLPEKVPVAKKTIRNLATAKEAAPTDFKMTLMPVSVSGFQLTWTDRASDEEGSFIEIKQEGKSDFYICALVEKNINKFGWALEPPNRKATLRVRPYYYGRSSQFVHLMTGPELPEESPKAPAPTAPKSAK